MIKGIKLNNIYYYFELKTLEICYMYIQMKYVYPKYKKFSFKNSKAQGKFVGGLTNKLIFHS